MILTDADLTLRPTFHRTSLECASSLPIRMIESSRDAGWTSLLLDHQQVLTSEDEFETHPTPDQTVVVMTRGEQEVEVYDRGRWKRATYRPGVVGKTPGSISDRLRRRVNADAGPACKINLYIPQALMDEAAAQLRRAGESPGIQSASAMAYADDALRIGAQSLLRALRAGAPSLYVDSMAHWLTVHLLTSVGNAHERYEAVSGTRSIKDKRLIRVLDYMNRNFSEQLTIERLAREAAVSKFHFTRLFHQATGVTPHRYLSDRRLFVGRRLLETTDSSISEIAAKCGFARPSYFATAFSKKYGMSPSDYRLAY